MKVIIHPKYGPPEVLQLSTLEKPVPKEHEVLIKVKATTVNRTDCAILRAKPFIMRWVTGFLKPVKIIPGTDFAGVIEAVGKDVVSFKAGEKVFGFDDSGLSSSAEYLTLSADKALTTIPKNVSYEQAAASSEGAHYAYNMLNKVNLTSGQKALVNGASGAIGSAALQFLKYFGLDVVAVCGTKNVELIKSLGANQVMDYTREDFTQTDQKFDFIFDTVGKSSFAKCKSLLNPGGVYLSSELGWMAQNIFFALFTPIFGKKKVIFPIPSDIKGSLLFIKKLMEEGKFKPVIDRQYPLEQIAEAYRYVEKGQKTGNVIITMDAGS
ncbi:MAG: NAD(P)-dependent alcohol dehydrogenase [Saprospiraceae bacterium]|nr:NAD(P)-dependent alcohol dehydrogenase [Saprospiraceae bacterium]MCB9325496.1 NAD(P)-dependent alcohol dehydrogenase [Lewinellaceae bacterium]